MNKIKFWPKYQKLIAFLIGIIFLAIFAIAYENKVFYIGFVDEQENFVTGKYLLEGQKLYSDIFANHQPLPFITSSLVQEVTRPNSLYLLVKRHREFIIFWSIVWCLFLILRFGWLATGFLLIYEPAKFYIFGNLFLAEALVVYPLVYLTSLVLFDSKVQKFEWLFLGICFAICIFLLSPIWPLLLLLFLLLFWKQRKNIKQPFLFFIVGFLPILAICLFFANPSAYLLDTIYINFKYFIPVGDNEPFPGAIYKAIFTPIISFLPTQSTPLVWIIRILSLSLLVGLVILIKKKLFKLAGLIVLILTLANIRFVYPGLQYFSGFHLLPWLAILSLSLLLIFKVILETKGRYVKAIFSLLISISIITTFYLSKDGLFQKRDMATDQYVNYSPQFQMGEAIKAMKDPNDQLFEEVDNYLILWQADINHAPLFVNFYPWMWDSPELKNARNNDFAANPPTFFYCQPCDTGNLPQTLDNYQVLNLFGVPSKLLVSKSRMSSLNSAQIAKLDFFHFSK